MINNHINTISQYKNYDVEHMIKEKVDEIIKQHDVTRLEVLEYRLEGKAGI